MRTVNALVVTTFFFSFPLFGQEKKDFSWESLHKRSGLYEKQVEIVEKKGNKLTADLYRLPFTAKIRLINIVYNGTPSRDKWRQAFEEAVQYYIKENVTYPVGGDGDFFLMWPGKARILGWVEETTGFKGYLVVAGMDGNKVYYVTSDGRSEEKPADPGNFENFPIAQRNLNFRRNSIGSDPDALDYDTYGVSIQVWKNDHTDPRAMAAAAFHLGKVSRGPSEGWEKPIQLKSLHFDSEKKRTYRYEQTGANAGGFLNVFNQENAQIHVGRYSGTQKIGKDEYHGYKLEFTSQTAPQWALDATSAGKYYIYLPALGYGKAIYVNDGKIVPDRDVPPAGPIFSQEYSYNSRSRQME